MNQLKYDDILDQAIRLHERLNNASWLMISCDPQTQIVFTQELSSDAELLKELALTVSTIYLQFPTGMPDHIAEELQAIEKWLKESTAYINGIQANCDIAIEIVELTAQVQEVYEGADLQNINPQVVKSLQGRIFDISCNKAMNKGNKDALLTLQETVGSKTLICPHSVALSSNLVLDQNETYEVALAQDQFKALKEKYNEDPFHNFTIALEFFEKVYTYCLNKPQFFISENEIAIKKVLEDLEDELIALLEKQEHVETELIQASHAQRMAKKGFELLLKALQTAQEEAKQADTENKAVNSNKAQILNSIEEKVQFAFLNLSPDCKEKLFDALSDVMLKDNKIKKPIPKTLLGQPFFVWNPSYSERAKAVQAVLSTFIIPEIELKSNLMVVQFNKVKHPGQSSVKHSQNNCSITIETPLNVHEGFNIVEFDEKKSSSNCAAKALCGMKDLFKLIPMLGDKGSMKDLSQFLGALMQLESVGHTVTFSISENKGCLIADRPCFHLYFIHKKESPELLVEILDYGSQAMGGAYPADNSERKRALQRAILELALEGLESAFLTSQEEDVEFEILGLLVDLQMDEKDVPELYLFEMFKMSLVSRENDPLEKVEKIRQFRERLKEFWKVQ